MNKVPDHILDYLVDTQVQVFAIPKRNTIFISPRRQGKTLAARIAHDIQNWGKRNNATLSGAACLAFIGIVYRALDLLQMMGAQ